MTAHVARILALLVAAVAARPATGQQATGRSAVQDTVLANGLQVLVVENHTVPLATVLVAVRGGASTQRPGQAGLAHLYEHVLFRSYGRSPSAFGQEVAALNGTHNGSTAEEVVSYYIIVPSEHAERAMRLLGGLLPRVRFAPFDLEEERPVVLDELARAESDPEQALERRVDQALWGAAWHRRDVIGDSLSLESITVDQLRDTSRRYYVPNNAALVVTGAVSLPDIYTAADRHFGGWRSAADQTGGPAPESFAPLTAHQVVTMDEPVQDFSIVFTHLGPGVRTDTADTYAMDVLVAVLNHPASQFQLQLVASGPFNYLDVEYRTLNDVGQITFSGKADVIRARNAVTALVAALDGPTLWRAITDEDLEIVQKQRALASALALEETATLAPSLAYWWAVAGIDYYRTYHSHLSRQTADDIRRVVDRYIARRARVVGLLGPRATVERIAAWLRQFAPSPR